MCAMGESIMFLVMAGMDCMWDCGALAQIYQPHLVSDSRINNSKNVIHIPITTSRCGTYELMM